MIVNYDATAITIRLMYADKIDYPRQIWKLLLLNRIITNINRQFKDYINQLTSNGTK